MTEEASSSIPDGNNRAARQHRIACLIPSATDICIALGLAENIVGITHECARNYLHNSNANLLSSSVSILTLDRVEADSLSQGEIHQRVVENSEQHSKSTPTNCSTIPSLYPILPEAFATAAPTLILTQDLCKVCAPSSDSVQALLSQQQHDHENTKDQPLIVSLTPHSLSDVWDNFTLVATACRIPALGKSLRCELQNNLVTLQQAIRDNRSVRTNTDEPLPRMLVLEWLDPPFDGGHWIPDMMEYAMVRPAGAVDDNDTVDDTVAGAMRRSRKSKALSWSAVQEIDANIVLIACCGFDLERNVQDAYKPETQTHLAQLRAAHTANNNNNNNNNNAGRGVFAANGDAYFARPGPHLLQGVAIMALCAYSDEPEVVRAIQSLPFVTQEALKGFERLDFRNASITTRISSGGNENAADQETPSSSDLPVPDMEDFNLIHQQACQEGEMFYTDPRTGYSVFTELAHTQRGRCCGSGCRHCPYNHENVSDKDRASKIQQPAFLHFGDDSDNHIFALKHGKTRVLFFSGGKDSFLTIRAMARQALQDGPFGLVLLTTFDAMSRDIAHQEMSIDIAQRQAEHLGVALVGVPVHRGSSESYSARIRRALDLIERHVHDKQVAGLVFGDLHLDHIQKWRIENMGSSHLGCCYELLFPLWKVGYKELAEDLEKSGVQCVVSASTVEGVTAGDVYDSAFRERIMKDQKNSIDLFGENGEFHTSANVWTVDRNRALGIYE